MGNGFARPMAADVESQEGDIVLEHGAIGAEEGNLVGLRGYLPLYQAVDRGNWNEAMRILNQHPEALRARISVASETALHIAVKAASNINFIGILIRRMSRQDLTLTDQNGDTALAVAATVGNIEAARLLVDRNADLPHLFGTHGFPIHGAAQFGQEQMFHFLLEVTRSQDIDPSPFTGQFGALLLIHVVTAEFYDIALHLVQRYPDMATTEVEDRESPLTVLARKSHSFPSGYGMPLLQQFRNCVKIMGANKWRQKSSKAIKLVKRLCMEILRLEDEDKALELLRQPLLIAAELGTHEIVEEIVKAFPHAVWAFDEDRRSVFQLAVLHRREKVFSALISNSRDCKNLLTSFIDSSDNNILHLAGQMPHPNSLTLVSRAALQVQRELQWFKEVEKFVTPAQKEAINGEGKTPWTVFKEAHQELITAGEKWMKGTAKACSVASTLITTIAFSAAVAFSVAVHVSDKNTIINRKAYHAFFVPDAVSFIFSVIAILVFLSIATSRYKERDFLKRLHLKLMFGLLTLFFSLLSMTIAFGAIIYIVFGPSGTIYFSVGAFAILLTVIMLISPLFYRYIKATFLLNIFNDRKDHKTHQSWFCYCGKWF